MRSVGSDGGKKEQRGRLITQHLSRPCFLPAELVTPFLFTMLQITWKIVESSDGEKAYTHNTIFRAIKYDLIRFSKPTKQTPPPSVSTRGKGKRTYGSWRTLERYERSHQRPKALCKRIRGFHKPEKHTTGEQSQNI